MSVRKNILMAALCSCIMVSSGFADTQKSEEVLCLNPDPVSGVAVCFYDNEYGSAFTNMSYGFIAHSVLSVFINPFVDFAESVEEIREARRENRD